MSVRNLNFEGWPALLRQELPDLTVADIEWLSDLSEEMEQHEPPTPTAVMDPMDADEQNLEGNARSTKRRYRDSARIANRDARAQPQKTIARPVTALSTSPRTVSKRKSHTPSQTDCRSTRQRNAPSRPSQLPATRHWVTLRIRLNFCTLTLK